SCVAASSNPWSRTFRRRPGSGSATEGRRPRSLWYGGRAMLPALLMLSTLLAQAPVPSPPDAGAPRVLSRSYAAMGTDVTFTAFTADSARAERAFAAAYDEIRRVELLMTDWDRPGQP